MQPFFSIKTIDSFMVYAPSFSSKQNMYSTVPIPHSNHCYLSDSFSKICLVMTFRSVSDKGTPDIESLTCSSFAHFIGRYKVLNCSSFHVRLYHFFETTSWSICLSKVKSATILFSREFSSSSCLSFLTSEGISPHIFSSIYRKLPQLHPSS